MRTLLGLLLMLAGFVLMTATADAGYYYSSTYRPGYSYYYASYSGGYYYPAGYYAYYNNYYQPVTVAAYVPYATYVPVAVSTYSPQYVVPATPLNATAPVAPVAAAAAGHDCTKQLTALEAKLKALELQLEKRLATTPTPPPTVPAPDPPVKQRTVEVPPEPLDGRKVFVNECGRCHRAEYARKVNGGLVLVKDDGLDPGLKAADFTAMYKAVLAGSMPKDRKLTQAQGEAILTYWSKVKVGDAE